MEAWIDEIVAAEGELKGPSPEDWFKRLDGERERLEEALVWSLQHDIARGLELAGAVWPFWMARGDIGRAREWYSRLLAVAPDEERTSGRAKALYGAGTLGFMQGERDEALRLHEESHSIARELGDRTLEADALIGLARVAVLDGDAIVMERYAQASLEAARAAGDERRAATALHHVVEALRRQGRYDEALPLYYESVERHRALGDRRGVALELHNLGNVARLTGDPEPAAARFRESLALAGELEHPRIAAHCLLGLAHVAAALGHWSRAARLLGASDALLAGAGAALDPDYRGDRERTREAVESALGEDAFAAETEAGAALGLQASVREGLA